MTRARAALISALILGAGTVAHDGAPTPTRMTLTRHFTPADQRSGRYQYVPFEVPPGTSALRIAYQYDRANGDNLVDLGLFEPGPLDLDTRAFRGYSGGARPSLTIDAAGASPGYRPGPLPPGRWHVLLGLYKVQEAGVDVTINVETDTGSPPSARRSSAVDPSIPSPSTPSTYAWYMGALHTHTLHSDGTVTPLELMRQMRAAGFDFVAITDHNNTTHRYELGPQYPNGTRPLWIVGEEVTTPNGHASVWGLDEGEWVDFRVRAEDNRIADIVRTARRYGALFSVNHPASECAGCGWVHPFVDEIEAVEISNGRHGEVARALLIWDRLLLSGRKITAVGSSDWHSAPNPIDVANVRVYAAGLTEHAILSSIRSGRVIVMNSAKLPTPEIVVRSGAKAARIGESLTLDPSSSIVIEIAAPWLDDSALVVVANGRRRSPVRIGPGGQIRHEATAAPGYVRFELFGPDQSLVAVTNPVYLDRR